MEAGGLPTLQDVVNLVAKEEAECRAYYEKAQLHEVAPWEFLSFAREDLEGGSERGLLNAIGNASRAIASRVDEIVVLSGLRVFMTRERWSLPYKLEVIKKLGCPAPYVIRGYITSIRNVLEHEYKRPPELAQIRYVADIGELFLSATDEYVGRGYIRSATVEVPGQEECHRERSKETRVTPYEAFTLEFDFPTDLVKLTYSQLVRTEVRISRTGEVREQGRLLSEPTIHTVSLAGCNKEHVVDLVRLLRQKSRL